MKITEYTIVQGTENRLHSIDAGKHDESELPEFSKEVPVSTRQTETGGRISVEHEWKETHSDLIRVKRADYRKGEQFADLYRIPARDGVDSVCFSHNNCTYIARKTVGEVAQALYNAYGKIKGAVECVVGYVRTLLGNHYVITKVGQDTWVFDKRMAKHGVNYVDVDNLDGKGKSKLTEMITEKIAELHAGSLIMGRFTLNNILFCGKDMIFTDLRKLRVSRKKAFVIDEFKSVLQYLFAIGVASREDVYASVAYYASINEQGCNDWYHERTGKNAADPLDIVCKVEEEVYS